MHVVIMAGGRGERFWPYGRRQVPKQFLKLFGEASLLQRTAQRVLPLVGWEQLYVVTTREYQAAVQEQLPHLPAANILVEPMGKNTAPCLALALAVLLHQRQVPGHEVMAVLPADHWIGDEEGFRRLLQAATEAALHTGSLVTLGITPTRPETGYGYIQVGQPLAEEGAFKEVAAVKKDGQVSQGVAVHRVRRFVEKPSRDKALRMLAEGGYLWNSGMFIWRLDALEKAFRNYQPELYRQLPALAGPQIEAIYQSLPAVSIDVGVMEKADDVLVLPASVGWSDVGHWDALGELMEPDEAGNAVRGRQLGVDSSGCVVVNTDEKHLVATVGVDDLVIVHTHDATLVCSRQRVQDVREVVARLRQQGLDAYL